MIRIAKIEDYERINELRKQVNDLHVNGRPDHFKSGWNMELQNHAMECMEAENKDILVAERDGIICGIHEKGRKRERLRTNRIGCVGV